MTLDDDVSAALDRIQAEQRTTFRQALNDLLREGLSARSRRQENAPREATVTPSRDLHPLVADFDRTSELISLIEGEMHR